jgi:hypothetical protein
MKKPCIRLKMKISKSKQHFITRLNPKRMCKIAFNIADCILLRILALRQIYNMEIANCA